MKHSNLEISILSLIKKFDHLQLTIYDIKNYVKHFFFPYSFPPLVLWQRFRERAIHTGWLCPVSPVHNFLTCI